MNTATNGHQYQLQVGDQAAVVSQFGATLREYRVREQAILAGFAPDEMCEGAAGQVLAPWPNRIDRGMYEFGGEHHLPINEPLRQNAIHGLVRWHDWSPVDVSSESVTLQTWIRPQPGFPFALSLELTYALGVEGLVVHTQVRNEGSGRAPFGLGFHPWLTVGSDGIDADLLHVPAETVLVTDDRMLPVENRRVADTEMDFRNARAIGTIEMDTCFTGLTRDREGRATVRLTSRDDSTAVEVWMDDSFPYVMVVTGDMLSAERRRQSLAIEPMTCPANAFQSGQDLLVLDPADARAFRWGIRYFPTAAKSVPE